MDKTYIYFTLNGDQTNRTVFTIDVPADTSILNVRLLTKTQNMDVGYCPMQYELIDTNISTQIIDDRAMTYSNTKIVLYCGFNNMWLGKYTTIEILSTKNEFMKENMTNYGFSTVDTTWFQSPYSNNGLYCPGSGISNTSTYGYARWVPIWNLNSQPYQVYSRHN